MQAQDVAKISPQGRQRSAELPAAVQAGRWEPPRQAQVPWLPHEELHQQG